MTKVISFKVKTREEAERTRMSDREESVQLASYPRIIRFLFPESA